MNISDKDYIDRRMSAVEDVMKEQTGSEWIKNVLETVSNLKKEHPNYSDYVANKLNELVKKYCRNFLEDIKKLYDMTNNILYHYTSLETLYKIFHNPPIDKDYIILRANYFMNMNDPFDCQYLIKEISQILFERDQRTSKEEIEKYLIDSMKEVGRPYFISLSELKDSLPMWQMYGDRGHGVAIGFSKDLLGKAVEKYQNSGNKELKAANKDCFCKLYKCNYWTKEDIKKEIVDKYEIELKEHEIKLNESNKEDILNNKDICSISSLIKHPSYDYERESRVVFLCNKSEKMKYKELCIPIEAIKEIVCGPCCDKDMVKKILCGFNCKNIKESMIPYSDR